MNLTQLARKDLNLLVTLLVLLEEKSVTATANKLFLTQPAISKSLSRLRELFNDPLFTRSSRGLVPTPFALDLQEPLNNLLESIGGLFVPENFNPATYQGRFVISAHELLDLTFMPMLAREISLKAPGIVLESHSQIDHQLSGLEQGELDAIINLKFAVKSDDISEELLLKDQPSIFANNSHPLHKIKKYTFDKITQYPRVELRIPDMEQYSLFSETNGQSGFARKWPIAYSTDNLISALSVISLTDYIMPGPQMLSAFSSKNLNFTALTPPLSTSIRLEYYLMMHKRVQRSPAHQWLHQIIIEVAGKL